MMEQDDISTENAEIVEDKPMTVAESVAAAQAELEAAEPETPEIEETAEAAPKTDDAPAEETPEAVEVEIPASWADGGVDHWSALTPEQRTFIVEREQARQEAIDRDRLPDNVRGLLTQIEDNAKLYGVTTDQALGRLFNAHRMLETNPKFGLGQLAAQYGVDLSQLAGVPVDAQAQQTEADPIQAVLQQVGQLVDQRFNQFAQTQEQQKLQTTEQEIDRWSKEHDSDGKPLRPAFDQVQHLIGPELQRLQAENPAADRWDTLQKAYDNVSPKSVDVDALVEERVAAALKERNEATDKARRASVSPAPTVSGTEVNSANGSESVMASVRRAAGLLEKETAGRI